MCFIGVSLIAPRALVLGLSEPPGDLSQLRPYALPSAGLDPLMLGFALGCDPGMENNFSWSVTEGRGAVVKISPQTTSSLFWGGGRVLNTPSPLTVISMIPTPPALMPPQPHPHPTHQLHYQCWGEEGGGKWE